MFIRDRNDTTLNLSFELLFDIAIPIPHHGIEKNVQPSVTKITPNKRLIIYKPSKGLNKIKIPIDIKEKYKRISKICLQYDVPVPAAALQFSYSNKLISSMILGVDRIEQIQQNFENLNYPIPKELWDNLIKENLLDERSMIDI